MSSIKIRKIGGCRTGAAVIKPGFKIMKDLNIADTM